MDVRPRKSRGYQCATTLLWFAGIFVFAIGGLTIASFVLNMQQVTSFSGRVRETNKSKEWINAGITTEKNGMFATDVSGQMCWGPGKTSTCDTYMGRSSEGTLTISSASLHGSGSQSARSISAASASGDANLVVDGKISVASLETPEAKIDTLACKTLHIDTIVDVGGFVLEDATIEDFSCTKLNATGIATVGGLVSGNATVKGLSCTSLSASGIATVGGLVSSGNTAVQGLTCTTLSASGTATLGGLVSGDALVGDLECLTLNSTGTATVGGLVSGDATVQDLSCATLTSAGVATVGRLVSSGNATVQDLSCTTLTSTGVATVGWLVSSGNATVQDLSCTVLTASGTATVGGLVSGSAQVTTLSASTSVSSPLVDLTSITTPGTDLSVTSTSALTVTHPLRLAVQGRLRIQHSPNANYYKPGGTIMSETTSVGNTDATETVLSSWNFTAASVSQNQDELVLEAWGKFGANANAKTLTVYWGSSVVYTSGALTHNGLDWTLTVRLIKSGATSAMGMGKLEVNGIAPHVAYTASISPVDWNVWNVFSLTGTGVASDDIQKGPTKYYFVPAHDFTGSDL